MGRPVEMVRSLTESHVMFIMGRLMPHRPPRADPRRSTRHLTSMRGTLPGREPVGFRDGAPAGQARGVTGGGYCDEADRVSIDAPPGVLLKPPGTPGLDVLLNGPSSSSASAVLGVCPCCYIKQLAEARDRTPGNCSASPSSWRGSRATPSSPSSTASTPTCSGSSGGSPSSVLGTPSARPSCWDAGPRTATVAARTRVLATRRAV